MNCVALAAHLFSYRQHDLITYFQSPKKIKHSTQLSSGSNPKPWHYEHVALPTALLEHTHGSG